MKILLVTVIGTSLLTGCGVIAAASVPEKLVAARHAQCDLGPVIVTYLASGFNSGHPELDEIFADEVNTMTAPQERAKADTWITNCDQNVDTTESIEQAAAVAEQVEQQQLQQEQQEQAAAAQRQAQQNVHLSAECLAAAGRFDSSQQRCYSTVVGNPSGGSGAQCSDAYGNSPTYLYPVNGSFQTGRDGDRVRRPGCFF